MKKKNKKIIVLVVDDVPHFGKDVYYNKYGNPRLKRTLNKTLEIKIPETEDIKRWFQLLVGVSEEAMNEDIIKTFKNKSYGKIY